MQADPPAVEQDRRVADAGELAGARLAAEGEHTLVLQEEFPLLGEEEREPRQVDLLLIRLHLGEVGVHGEVGDEVVRDGVLHVEPDIAGRHVRQPLGRRADPVQLGDGVRLQLQVDAGVRHFEADQRGGLRNLHDGAEVERSRQRHERRVLVVPDDAALDVEAPHLLPARTVAQRPEGDDRLERPAAVEASHLHAPDGVPVLVPAALVADLAVHPPADGIDDELHRVAAVVERVEHDADVLPQSHAIPAHVVGDPFRLRRRAVAADRDVQVVVVEQHPDFRLLRGDFAFVRKDLDEARRGRHVPVHLLVEIAVDVEGRGQPHRTHRRLVGRVARNGGWRQRRRRTVDRLRRLPGIRRTRILAGLRARGGRRRQHRQHGQSGGEYAGAQPPSGPAPRRRLRFQSVAPRLSRTACSGS